MGDYHHGAYLTSGKESMMALIGAQAVGAVQWNTTSGQNVINTSPGHFVTTNGLSYPNEIEYADEPRGVAPGVYPVFNNTPDERYPNFAVHPMAEEFTVLFGSDHAGVGGAHLIGFTHRRAAWEGVVVGYQPGEHQPQALDDLEGPNFQILANAILYAAGAAPDLEPADIDGDGFVGAADLAALLGAWGSCVDCAADLDDDGVVGPADLALMLSAWGAL